jgi:AcrR family transcriptional regulator
MKKSFSRPESYHHGHLRKALLDAAEAILKRDGLQALSLRACAREAGVSHAAPAHHFPNLAALLSELAAVGYERLAASLRKAMAGKNAEAIEAGRAYVRFAENNREMFFLMSDPSRLDAKNSVLSAARRDALIALAAAGSISIEEPTLQQLGEVTRNWAVVHGFSMLTLTGRLGSLLRMAPPGTTMMDLLESTLSSSRAGNGRKRR